MAQGDGQTSSDESWQEVEAQQDPKGPGQTTELKESEVPVEPEEPGEPNETHMAAQLVAGALATAVGIYIALARRRSST